MLELAVGPRSPTVERTVMLTDAVVAIAMTLLVLPLVEAVNEVNLDDVGAFAAEHASLFVSFVVSFLVILLFWAAHHRFFPFVTEMTQTLRMLNAAWLLVVAFVPFPTALIGRGPTTSTTPVYIGTILVLGILSAAMVQVVAGTSANRDAARYLRRRAGIGWAAVGVMVVCALVSTVKPDLGLVGLAGILVVRVLGNRWAGEPATIGVAQERDPSQTEGLSEQTSK